MIYTELPGLAFAPSVICLGVAEFGSKVSAAESFAMLDDFAACGGNCADSAHIYAAWLPDGWGQSERVLGAWLQSRQPRDFFVATKGGHPDLQKMSESRLSPDCLAHDLAESCERLGRDRIDLYWLHRDDTQVPVGEIIDALNDLIRARKIVAIGASNWSAARIEAANRYAEKRGLVGFCVSQIGWSLATVNPQVRGAGSTIQMDDELLAWHRHKHFPVMAYSSQANGFFHYALPAANQEMTAKQKALATSYLNDQNRARYRRATELARALNRTAPEVALAYHWSQNFPSVAIVGATKREQLRETLRAADLQLAPENVAFLEG